MPTEVEKQALLDLQIGLAAALKRKPTVAPQTLWFSGTYRQEVLMVRV